MTESPQEISAITLDGAAIVQMLKPIGVTTFEQYAQDIFKPYIMSQLNAVDRVDIVWDTYKVDSLKSSTREKRGKGIRRRVTPSTAFPKNWKISCALMTIKNNYFTISHRFLLLGRPIQTRRSWSQTVLKCFSSSRYNIACSMFA